MRKINQSITQSISSGITMDHFLCDSFPTPTVGRLIDLVELIEFSNNKDYVKNPAHRHKVEKTPPGRGKRTTCSPYKRGNGNNGIQNTG